MTRLSQEVAVVKEGIGWSLGSHGHGSDFRRSLVCQSTSILATELIFEFTTGPATGVHCITGFFAAIRRRHRSGCARRGVDSPIAVSVMFRTELDT